MSANSATSPRGWVSVKLLLGLIIRSHSCLFGLTSKTISAKCGYIRASDPLPKGVVDEANAAGIYSLVKVAPKDLNFFESEAEGLG